GFPQNKYFTKMWFAMKTFFTPIIFIIPVWYWRQITMLTHAPVLLENDQNDQTWLSGYWKWVGPIAVGSFCLFIFVIYK
ncbi:unnamed protein product, partial [Caretta caretta]